MNILQPTPTNTYEIKEWIECGCLIINDNGTLRVLTCKDHKAKLSEDLWL